MTIDTEKLAKVIALIEKTADYKLHTDYIDEDDFFNPADASDGNFDDCYRMGCEDGEVNFARELMELLK